MGLVRMATGRPSSPGPRPLCPAGSRAGRTRGGRKTTRRPTTSRWRSSRPSRLPRGRQDGGTAEPGPAPQPGCSRTRSSPRRRRNCWESGAGGSGARGPGRGVHQTGGVYDEIVVDPCHGAWASFLDQLWSDDEHGVHNVLDVCCTGLLAGELAALGYQVVGLDGSRRCSPAPVDGSGRRCGSYDRRFRTGRRRRIRRRGLHL